MARTFSSNAYTTTQTLTNPATDNPATVTATGVIDVNSTIGGAAGIFGTTGFAWTLTNLGTVESIGSGGGLGSTCNRAASFRMAQPMRPVP